MTAGGCPRPPSGACPPSGARLERPDAIIARQSPDSARQWPGARPAARRTRGDRNAPRPARPPAFLSPPSSRPGGRPDAAARPRPAARPPRAGPELFGRRPRRAGPGPRRARLPVRPRRRRPGQPQLGRRPARHLLQGLPRHRPRRRGRQPRPLRPRRPQRLQHRPDQRHRLLLQGHRRQCLRRGRPLPRGLRHPPGGARRPDLPGRRRPHR